MVSKGCESGARGESASPHILPIEKQASRTLFRRMPSLPSKFMSWRNGETSSRRTNGPAKLEQEWVYGDTTIRSCPHPCRPDLGLVLIDLSMRTIILTSSRDAHLFTDERAAEQEYKPVREAA